MGAKARATAAPDPQEDLERLLAPVPASHGRPRALAELRADAERRADAVENVRAGRAHPVLFDLLRSARDRLTPEATRIAEQLPLGPAETTAAWTRGYLGAVADAQHGKFAPIQAQGEAVDSPRPDVLGGYDEAQRQAEAGAEARTAEVCLGVAPSHAVVVTLRRSSGNAALDRLAVDSFRAAGDGHSVTSDVRPGLACYRVRISAYRMPPLPTIAFDGRKILYPLRRMTKVTVDLESLDFGPGRAPPSLLDAP